MEVGVIWQVCFNNNPAERRILTPVSNFCWTHQMAVSTAPPSSLVSTCWVSPTRGKCAAGSSYWTLLLLASLSICAFKSGHRFLSNLQHAQPSTPRSRFVLTTAAVSIPTLYRFARTTQRAQIRSFCWSGTDRPFRPICRSPSADFQSRCVRFLHYQLVLRLPHSDAVHTTAPKPNLSVASSQDAPMLPSARSRRAGRSSVDSGRWLGGSSVPASFLQQSSRHNGPL